LSRKRSRSLVTTGISVVTSAVLPGALDVDPSEWVIGAGYESLFLARSRHSNPARDTSGRYCRKSQQ
jgi:hypothetical protein